MGTHYVGSRSEIRALDAFIKVQRGAESLTALTSRQLAAHDLTLSQFGVLEALYHLGPLHQANIAKKLLKSSGNITIVVDNLERDGLVARKRKKEDRRFVLVHLTAKGKRRIKKVFAEHKDLIVKAMSKLKPKEQEELGRLSKKLGLALAVELDGTGG